MPFLLISRLLSKCWGYAHFLSLCRLHQTRLFQHVSVPSPADKSEIRGGSTRILPRPFIAPNQIFGGQKLQTGENDFISFPPAVAIISKLGVHSKKVSSWTQASLSRFFGLRYGSPYPVLSLVNYVMTLVLKSLVSRQFYSLIQSEDPLQYKRRFILKHVVLSDLRT